MVSITTDQSYGTGVVVRENGLIITALHIVQGATTITVEFSDGSRASARLLGEDLGQDLAALKVPRSGLSAIQIRDDRNLRIGQAVSKLGYSGGYLALSTGVVAALVPPYRLDGPMVEVTTPINPGDSGSAVINDAGELVAIVVAKFFDLSGVGFASPLDNQLVNRLAEGERICQPTPPGARATTLAHPNGWFVDLPRRFEQVETNRVGTIGVPWVWVFIDDFPLSDYLYADELVEDFTVSRWTYTQVDGRTVCHPSGMTAWEFEYVVVNDDGTIYDERKVVIRTDRSWYLLNARTADLFTVEQEVDTVLYSFRFDR